jgi:hypothetical protein
MTTSTQKRTRPRTIRAFLGEIDPKYKDAKVKVWRQSRICGLLRRFPAVSLQIKNLADFQLLSHDQWSGRWEMRQDFIAAPDQQKVIESLRAAIRDDSQGMIHVRLIGEPGIGKTRLILETLRADDVRPLALYAAYSSLSLRFPIRSLAHALGGDELDIVGSLVHPVFLAIGKDVLTFGGLAQNADAITHAQFLLVTPKPTGSLTFRLPCYSRSKVRLGPSIGAKLVANREPDLVKRGHSGLSICDRIEGPIIRVTIIARGAGAVRKNNSDGELFLDFSRSRRVRGRRLAPRTLGRPFLGGLPIEDLPHRGELRNCGRHAPFPTRAHNHRDGLHDVGARCRFVVSHWFRSSAPEKRSGYQ